MLLFRLFGFFFKAEALFFLLTYCMFRSQKSILGPWHFCENDQICCNTGWKSVMLKCTVLFIKGQWSPMLFQLKNCIFTEVMFLLSYSFIVLTIFISNTVKRRLEIIGRKGQICKTTARIRTSALGTTLKHQ